MNAELQPSATVAYDASIAITLASNARKALQNASELQIDSQTMYALAAGDLQKIKALQKEVEAQRTSITGPLNQALKSVNALFANPKQFLDEAEAKLKQAMVAWTSEQERLAALARAEAEAAARAERERLEAVARAEAEAANKARADAQAAAALGDAVAAKAAIEKAEAAESAVAVAELTANVVTATPAVDGPAKVSGISARVTYSAAVQDLMKLVQAVASGAAPIEAIQADNKFLSAQARAFKREGEIYPGVVAVAERSIAARA